MAKLYNLARMTTATTGTGTITLGSAVSGYLTFALAGVANGDVVDYGIKDGSNSEVGTGTYTSSGTTLTRSVTKSTNSNSAINLSGAAEVYITVRAETLTGHLPGEPSNTAASAGEVGELLVSSGTSGSLTTATATQVATLSLTAGDWDVSFTIQANTAGATTLTDFYGSVSLTSATIGAPLTNSIVAHDRQSSASSDHANCLAHCPVQVLVSSTTSVYLNVRADFGSTAPTCTYVLRARRVR